MGQSTIKDIILKLVTRRGADKTICPSEVARAYADEEEWRKYMANVLEAAGNLKSEGYIQIEQNGMPVDLDQVSGPIRLRLKSIPPSFLVQCKLRLTAPQGSK